MSNIREFIDRLVKGRVSRKSPGKWQRIRERGRLRVYISCPKDGTVLKLDGHNIDKDGAVKPCVACDTCKTHLWCFLLDWKPKKKASRHGT